MTEREEEEEEGREGRNVREEVGVKSDVCAIVNEGEEAICFYLSMCISKLRLLWIERHKKMKKKKKKE